MRPAAYAPAIAHPAPRPGAKPASNPSSARADPFRDSSERRKSTLWRSPLAAFQLHSLNCRQTVRAGGDLAVEAGRGRQSVGVLKEKRGHHIAFA
jgi:hypothetical protein